MVLVDSSVWIEALHREGRLDIKLAVEGLLEADEARICAPIRLKVLGGARQEDREEICRHLSVIPDRPCSEDDWARATRLTWKCRDAGLALSPDHALIAAIALHDGVRIFATDEMFHAISSRTGLPLYVPGRAGLYQPA
jgi:predicted nucleic acid-binding protein